MKNIRNSHLRVVKSQQLDKIDHLESVIIELLIKDKDSKLHEFAKKIGVTPREILEKNKSEYITDVRHLYCYLRCEIDGETYSKVGKEIYRSHNAVSKGVKRIIFLLSKNYTKIEDMWDKVKCISNQGRYRAMY